MPDSPGRPRVSRPARGQHRVVLTLDRQQLAELQRYARARGLTPNVAARAIVLAEVAKEEPCP